MVTVGARRDLDERFDPGLDDAGLLEAVASYYHQVLIDDPKVLGWLSEHGVRDGEALERFTLGFVDRSLGLRIPEANRVAGRKLREHLMTLGVLRDSGHEALRACMVVPVTDGDGRVVQLFGHRVGKPQRRDGEDEATTVVWLPVPERGVWNGEAMAASAEVIIAKSVLEGLVWWSAGYRHVIAPGGPAGLPENLADLLVDAGATRALLAQARTAEGDADAERLAGELTGLGIECFRVVFPNDSDVTTVAKEAKDATVELGERLRSALWLGEGPAPDTHIEVVGNGPTPPARPRAVGGPRPVPAVTGPGIERADTPADVAAAPIASPVPPPAAGRDLQFCGGELRTNIGGLAWRVRGLDRVGGPGALRVTVSVSPLAESDRFHLDVVDLFSARARAAFVKAAAIELGSDEERLRRDLGRLILVCEDRIADLQAQVAAPEPERPAMSATDEAAALELLRDPRLLERIAEDVAPLGVVGEADNALVAYLAATSRLLDAPLAVVIQSGSAAGKSTLVDAVLSLMPAEQRVAVSAMTGQSLYYLGETALVHKVLAVAEAEGAERASYALKLLQSDGELSIASTGKNPLTGELVTRTYRVQGPVALFLTTTAPSLDDELANRCLVIGVDEDQAQTRAILAAQRQAQTVAGLLARAEREEIRHLHANAQRLLEPMAVVNPLAPRLGFPDGRTRARRDHAKFLTLIRAVALLHQHQRTRKRATRHGVEVVYIEATQADIEVAERLAPVVFAGHTAGDLAPQTRRLLVLLSELVSEQSRRERCRREDIRFTRRTAREAIGWSDFALRRHLGRLVELEFVGVHRSGNSFVYELLWHPGTGEAAEICVYGDEVDGVAIVSRGHLAVVARPAGS
jgi:DNA primase